MCVKVLMSKTQELFCAVKVVSIITHLFRWTSQEREAGSAAYRFKARPVRHRPESESWSRFCAVMAESCCVPESVRTPALTFSVFTSISQNIHMAAPFGSSCSLIGRVSCCCTDAGRRGAEGAEGAAAPNKKHQFMKRFRHKISYFTGY